MSISVTGVSVTRLTTNQCSNVLCWTRCPPTRPWQVYLRRPPLSHDVSLSARINAADKLMSKNDIEYLLELLMLYETEGPAALGRVFFCKKGATRGGASALSRRLWKMLAEKQAEDVAAGLLLGVPR
jgi:hypothetical protein